MTSKRTLKPENLMIGDWVLADGKPQKVSGIRNGQIITENMGDYQTVEPMPITPEILSSIAEETHEHNRTYWSLDDELFFRIYTFSEPKVLVYELYFDMVHDAPVFGRSNVHELQQKLRLFGYPSAAEKIKP